MQTIMFFLRHDSLLYIALSLRLQWATDVQGGDPEVQPSGDQMAGTIFITHNVFVVQIVQPCNVIIVVFCIDSLRLYTALKRTTWSTVWFCQHFWETRQAGAVCGTRCERDAIKGPLL